ncbi:MAG: TatD family hydrolase, partial [Oxalobacter sp.]|nr:TatD family hydrolase [Oxalobacter sp.]
TLPIDTIVVETDSPDLPPAWKNRKENSPLELPRIGEIIAALRGIPAGELAEHTRRNAIKALPKLAQRLSV